MSGTEPSVSGEVWRPISGFERLYEVSSMGRVRSLARQATPGKVLKSYLNASGYQRVTLSAKGVRSKRMVHQLVAETFLDVTGPCVRHRNGDQLDNRVEKDRKSTRLNSSHV